MIAEVIDLSTGATEVSHVHDNKDCTYVVTYTPVHPGPHRIRVLVNNVDIHRSPFAVEVIGKCLTCNMLHIWQCYCSPLAFLPLYPFSFLSSFLLCSFSPDPHVLRASLQRANDASVDAVRCVAAGDGLEKTFAGEQTFFIVEVCDSFELLVVGYSLSPHRAYGLSCSFPSRTESQF